MDATPLPKWLLRGRYRLVELVGRGGAGMVYRALDELTNESVAVKHLVAISPVAWARFESEACLLARVKHPSLAESHGVWIEAGERLMLMRYVHGPDLGARLAQRGRPFGVRSVLEWANHLLDALTYLHAHGIVHHDIKPRNIKLDAKGRAVLLDFGLAREMCASRGDGPTGYTAAYSPPEQVLGAHSDPRSDLYALGATLYELFARRSPPPALERVLARAACQADPLPRLDTVNPALPRDVAAVVHSAVELDPAKRQSDAVSMRRDLVQAIERCQRSLPADDHPSSPQQAVMAGSISGHDDDTVHEFPHELPGR